MRKELPVKSRLVVDIQSTPNGANIVINEIVIADIVGSTSVIANLRNTIGTLTIHASLGQLIELLTGQWNMEQSGWNVPSPGNEVEKEEVKSLEQLAESPPLGLMARATETFKGAFDWMMG